MKKLLLLFFLIALSSTIHCQSWFPLNATWHYSAIRMDTSTGYYYQSFLTMNVTKDTLISGRNCKVIERSIGTCDLFPSEIIISEESGTVLLLNSAMTAFDTLIDMNKNIGEHWYFSPANPASADSILISVTGKGTKIINGDTLNAMQVQVSNNDWEWPSADSIIEKIGFYPGFFLYQYYSCDNQTGPLRCYEDSELGLFETGGSDFCEEEIGAGLNSFDSDNLIYPNPATNQIVFSFSDPIEKITIYSIDLKEVVSLNISGDSTTVLDISTLRNGQYIIKTETHDAVIFRMLQKTY